VKKESERILRIVQITDPHIGPVMPVERLRKICEDIVKINPDLVLLTGYIISNFLSK
jgi:predicted MPP superfamily phosphohydrolase